jgi:hypothetical protein
MFYGSFSGDPVAENEMGKSNTNRPCRAGNCRVVMPASVYLSRFASFNFPHKIFTSFLLSRAYTSLSSLSHIRGIDWLGEKSIDFQIRQPSSSLSHCTTTWHAGVIGRGEGTNSFLVPCCMPVDAKQPYTDRLQEDNHSDFHLHVPLKAGLVLSSLNWVVLFECHLLIHKLANKILQ